jgi:hypothetical protein
MQSSMLCFNTSFCKDSDSYSSCTADCSDLAERVKSGTSHKPAALAVVPVYTITLLLLQGHCTHSLKGDLFVVLIIIAAYHNCCCWIQWNRPAVMDTLNTAGQ